MEKHRNGTPNPRVQDTLNLKTFPNEDEETTTSTAIPDVCTRNVIVNVASVCLHSSLNGDAETGKLLNANPSRLEPIIPDNLDKYLTSNLFTAYSDLDLETTPRIYKPDFSNSGGDTDAVLETDVFKTSSDAYFEAMPGLNTSDFITHKSDIDGFQLANTIETSTLSGDVLKRQKDSMEVINSKYTINLTNIPSLPSKPYTIENQPQLPSSSNLSSICDTYFKPSSKFRVKDNGTKSEELDVPSASPEHGQKGKHLKKVKELERELEKIQQQLQRDLSVAKAVGVFDKPRKTFVRQRSISDSHIPNCIEFEDVGTGQGSTYELDVFKSDHHDKKMSRSKENINISKSDSSSTIKHDQTDKRAPSYFENIETKTTKLDETTAKGDREGTDGNSQSVAIEVDARVELSCPCRNSCRHVARLVAAENEYIWVSFFKCPWVSLYNNKHERVYTFDTRYSVDSLAMSSTGVLYVSCPPEKKIIMLANRKMTVLMHFTKLFPRGVAVSPEDGTLVVCMVPQAVGNVMKGPSKDSCLMRFKGEVPNKPGKIFNKGKFGYPVNVTVNMDGFVLVSDFGLSCLFVLDKGGNMMRTFSTIGGRSLQHVHALTSNPRSAFFVVQGGNGTLSITRLVEYLGEFLEISTSTKTDTLGKRTVTTSSMCTDNQIVIASGNIIAYASLVY